MNIELLNGKIKFNNKTLSLEFFLDNNQCFYKKDNKEFKTITLDNLNSEVKKARIEITLKCNMACNYCIVYKNFVEQANNHMSLENAKKTLDKINSYWTIKSLMIIWWEPLSNPESLKYLCTNFDWKKAIFTNWYFITPEWINFFNKTNSRIMISLDWKRNHNINRLDKSGNETFSIIVDKIKLIKKYWWNFTLNTLVTNNTVNELYDIFIYFVEELKIDSFWLSYPHYTKENIEFAKDFDYKEYTKNMKKIFDYSKKNWIYVNQLKNILKYVLYWKKKEYACKIVWEQITFYPDWKQTFCTKLDKLEKKVTPYEIKRDLPIISNEKCDSCISKMICWGGCPWDNEFDESKYDIRMCHFNIELTNYIIEDIYNEALILYNNWLDIDKWLESIYSKMLKK